MKFHVLLCSINTLKRLYEISSVEVGQHLYWQLGGFQVHAQVLITSCVVIAILLVSAILVVRNPQTIPSFGQNFFKYVLEFIRDVSKTQIGEEYGLWVPFVGTMFLFIFVSNWSRALLPWKIIQLPHGELAALTNDINTTVALALLTSVAYLYACLSKKGLAYFVPLVVPIPVMFLGLFTSGIQALIFATLAAAYIAMGLNLNEILENVCYPELFLSFLNDKEKIGSKENAILEFYQQFACVGGDPIFSESLCKELQKKKFTNNVN
ncbi:hypothetical protein Ahy_A10g048834 [Arachis hypogaea]|uniref:RNA polymerase Rpb2 domain-containing protein n=1 Tax=Arachis hypogaea TaxID=3818 RepID=A0A445B605_ARAHY|nr:hypothetical protein Ahy_A10g048834 [Arachis hypogaea]